MNRQQFLSELNQYLSVFSAAERESVISYYSAKFDAAGADGEAALLLELGTPMMVTIALKRRHEAGLPLVDESEQPQGELSPTPSEEYEMNIESESESSEPEAEEAPNPSVTEISSEPEQAHSDEQAPGDETEPQADPTHKDETQPQAAEPTPRSTGAVVSCVLLSIVTSLLALAIMGVGVYFIAVMGNFLVVALQNLNMLNNALLLFAGGLISGALGIVVVWLGLWSAIRIISKLIAKTRA